MLYALVYIIYYITDTCMHCALHKSQSEYVRGPRQEPICTVIVTGRKIYRSQIYCIIWLSYEQYSIHHLIRLVLVLCNLNVFEICSRAICIIITWFIAWPCRDSRSPLFIYNLTFQVVAAVLTSIDAYPDFGTLHPNLRLRLWCFPSIRWCKH